MSSSLNHFLQAPLTEIVRNAQREILAVYNTSFGIDRKHDNSPITEADRRSHDMIVTGLQRLDSRIPIVSEESTAPAFEIRSKWDKFWLVDPLDGTKEFVKRSGEFTINIALVERHQPVLGMVGLPAMDSLYFGVVANCSALRIVGSDVQPIHTRQLSPPGLTVLMSRRRRDPVADQYLQLLESDMGPIRRESYGSSLKFLKLACGDADIHLQYGLTSEWDTAASHAILLAAGGNIATLDGGKLLYNCEESLLNRPFIAFGDQSHDAMNGLQKHLHVFSAS